ncbi:hypothetical protein NDU88_005873 [Pleurodeles waltl]|uniref:Uncharacterized protein n=1 Tax=Pleurodeles waltl TaxID=8319 RepID=A0AAV7L3T2_PLEWA|nr:hypothetical protein NDU88_005873 [Pleurodeles waltl]
MMLLCSPLLSITERQSRPRLLASCSSPCHGACTGERHSAPRLGSGSILRGIRVLERGFWTAGRGPAGSIARLSAPRNTERAPERRSGPRVPVPGFQRLETQSVLQSGDQDRGFQCTASSA